MGDTESSDAALVQGIGLGSEDAFVELYRRRQHDVYRFAYAMARSSSIAQDVTQDVFLSLLQNWRSFRPQKGSVRAWLLGCARHAIIDRLRVERRWVRDLPDEASAPCSGEQQVFEQQRLGALHTAIASLPIQFREALVLCELEELSYAEAAAILSCPIGTVRSRLHRARALLAARLKVERPSESVPMLRATEVCR